MSFRNATIIDDLIEEYFDVFGTEDIRIFNMPLDDQTTREYVRIVKQAIEAETPLDRDNLVERLGLNVPSDAFV
jgi:hypothetical protein